MRVRSQGNFLLVEGNVSLGGRIRGFKDPKPDPMSFFLLPADPDPDLSAASPAPYLPICHKDANGLHFRDCK